MDRPSQDTFSVICHPGSHTERSRGSSLNQANSLPEDLA